VPKPKRRPPRGGAKPRKQRAARQQDEPDLIREVAAALDDGEPMSLLVMVSSLLAALDVRRNPFGPSAQEPQPELPSKDELLTTFFDVDMVETSALLAAIAALSGDEALRDRASEEIAARGHELPRWLAGLSTTRPLDRAVEVSHVLGDGDNVMIGVRLPGDDELTAIVYIDHNLGTMVKDAFIVDQPLAGLVEQMLEVANDPDTATRDLAPADARARITEAIELAAMAWPPIESDSWPACRPLVEWMARMLPAGGSGYQRPEWGEAATNELAERFFGSSFAAGLTEPEHRDLLGALLWFGADYGPGDPMRWSPVAVEILLTDWLPRKIVADVEYLAKAPGVLRAFARFCHHERGIRSTLTEQTLAAVDAYEPQYQRTIRSPRPQGPEALLASLGAMDPDGPWPSPPQAGSQGPHQRRRKR
jgi:hypothetical protein